jgi:hypothetical protein
MASDWAPQLEKYPAPARVAGSRYGVAVMHQSRRDDPAPGTHKVDIADRVIKLIGKDVEFTTIKASVLRGGKGELISASIEG